MIKVSKVLMREVKVGDFVVDYYSGLLGHVRSIDHFQEDLYAINCEYGDLYVSEDCKEYTSILVEESDPDDWYVQEVERLKDRSPA